MPKITVYTTTNCPYCMRAKDLLKKKNLTFEEIDLGDKPEELVALKNRTGLRTVPQIFVGETLVGGFQELKSLDVSGDLDKMLAS